MSTLARLEQERAPAAAFHTPRRAADAQVRARAILALARLERLDAAPALLDALSDPDARVRQNAAFGLGQLDLAFAPTDSAHERMRESVEGALVHALTGEPDPATQHSLIRAIGRLAVGGGLDALVALAGTTTSSSAEALTALGVSGARRKASRSQDRGLLSVVTEALRSPDGPRRVAAAYAVFRQMLRMDSATMDAAVQSTDPQTRVFVVRAAAHQDPGVRAALVAAGLRDVDWRVAVEAVRVATTTEVPDTLLAAVSTHAETAARALASGGSGARAHIVREACDGLARVAEPPADAAQVLDRIVRMLGTVPEHHAVACACAVALDVVSQNTTAASRCGAGEDDGRSVEREIAVIAHGRTTPRERIASLRPFMAHDERRVRLAAANALIDIGGMAAAEAAAGRLLHEQDPAIASMLLSLWVDDADVAAALDDRALAAMAQRFHAGTTFEELEPMTAVVTLARRRSSPEAAAVVREAMTHPDVRVRDVALGIAVGDRAPGARAAVIASESTAALPTHARLRTSRGDITIAFEPALAPATVTTIAALARAGSYAGTPFHRVIGDFVAQGGDPRGDGTGGPGFTIACENSDAAFVRGAVGMATSGKDTGGSQFFLTHSWQPHLDGRYTLFGRVIEGLDVMDTLQPHDVVLAFDVMRATDGPGLGLVAEPSL